MTDNEIIKALECHADTDIKTCKICPYDGVAICGHKLCYDALDLINRQKAEIDKCHKQLDEFKFLASRVNSIKNTSKDTFTSALLTIAEGVGFQEAVAEVVERLKKSSSTSIVVDGDREIPETRIYSISEIKLDSLIKEMVGEG